MIYDSTCEYAIHGLSELATHSPGRWIMLHEIIDQTGLPRDFLAKIFQRLVRKKILKSIRGRGGGFALARSPSLISILDVLKALEAAPKLDECVVGLTQCNATVPCPQHDLYEPIRRHLKDYLASTTLAQLADSLRVKKGKGHHRNLARKNRRGRKPKPR